MLIKDKNNDFIINMEHISNLFIDSDNNLVCTVPSPLGNNGYENFNLISNNHPAGQFHIRRISALYRQYVVSELGTFIPPKVYEIPSRDESYGISMSNVSITIVHGTGRISADNRVVFGWDVRHRGTVLVEGKDYTVICPLYKGDNQQYAFLFYFLQSRSYRIQRLNVGNYKFGSIGTDVEINSNTSD